MNLFGKVMPEAQMLLIEDVGTAGFSNTAFTDDAWDNKKLFPGHVWPSPTAAWKPHRTISHESFMLFASHVIHQQRDKIPTLRRKWDKSALEEVAQLAALCYGVAGEACANLPGEAHTVVADEFARAFVLNDPMVVLELQTAVHDLSSTFKWDDITVLAEIGQNARTKALD